MYNKLIIGVLCLFLSANFIKAEEQKIYFFSSKGEIVPVENGLVETDSELFSFFWSKDNGFIAPWQIIVANEQYEVVSDVEVDNIPAHVVDMSEYDQLQIVITSINGMQKHFKVHYQPPFPWGDLFGALCILIVILYLIHLHIQMKITEKRNAEQKELSKTKKYDSATVLFSDIQGFTKISEHMNPEQLVDELDKYFIYFDELVERYDVEKIKTIGDAYMCAGGVPNLDSANPIEVTLVGLEMINYIKERQKNGAFWNMRVGIHTGPLVSAVLGNKKKSFDIWGDSVNTASRMESSGVPGEVNISGDTYIKIADYFECQYRGKMPVKYKGEIDMYFVKGLKPEFSECGSNCKPNKTLITRIQGMKVDDVLNVFETQLKQTLDEAYVRRLDMLMIQSEMLSYAEGLTLTETMFVKLTMLHLFSQNECPKNFRINANNLIKRLDKAHFDHSEIDELLKLVNRANILKTPEGKVEEVIYDAFYMIYCRKDIVNVLSDMQICAINSGKNFNKKDWIESQILTMKSIEFKTQLSRELVEVPLVVQKNEFEQIIRQI